MIITKKIKMLMLAFLIAAGMGVTSSAFADHYDRHHHRAHHHHSYHHHHHHYYPYHHHHHCYWR